MTNPETVETLPAEDFGAAEHLAAIERMYQEGLAHITFLAQSWSRPATVPVQAARPRNTVTMTRPATPLIQPKTAA